MERLEEALGSGVGGALTLPAALLLGAALALGSSCNWPALAAVTGYAASRRGSGGALRAIAAAGFLAGTAAALAALGALFDLWGRIGGAPALRAGRIVGGLAAIVLGLAAADMVPFRLPSPRLAAWRAWRRPGGALGAAGLGFSLGLVSMTSTGACCGAALPVSLGLAYADARLSLGPMPLIAFAGGYSLPVFAVLLGVGLGRLTPAARRLDGPIRLASGGLMVLSGFWLILS